MRENYSNLCSFNFGKRCYVVMKNFDKVVYFESVNDNYVMPIISFNLYDNEGKSLTVVNQHFFMNQLVNRINIALSKGYFSNDNDIIDYLKNIKSVTENDVELKNLFKGCLIGEINVENFEDNKRKLLKYLDKFKLETYIDYSSVSVFDGTLEKDSSIIQKVSEEVVESDQIKNQNNEFNSVQLDVNNNDTVEVESDDDIDVIDVLDSNFDNLDVSSIKGFDFIDSDLLVVDDNVETVNSNDYFSSIGGQSINSGSSMNNLENSYEQVNNLSNSVDNSFVNPIDSYSVGVDNNVVDVNKSLSLNYQNNNLQSNQSDNSFSSYNDFGLNNTVLNNEIVYGNSIDNSFNLNDNQNSYIDEVRNRIQTNNSSLGSNGFDYSNEISSEAFIPNDNVNLNNKVISDKNDLPEIGESISDSDTVVKKEKKSKVGIVTFLIILIPFLIVISYFLYIYVF